MFRNSELTTLAFLTGGAAFYAQQTDQTNLFLGAIVVTAILLMCRFRKETVEAQEEIEDYANDSARDELWDKIHRLEDEISEIKG